MKFLSLAVFVTLILGLNVCDARKASFGETTLLIRDIHKFYRSTGAFLVVDQVEYGNASDFSSTYCIFIKMYFKINEIRGRGALILLFFFKFAQETCS